MGMCIVFPMNEKNKKKMEETLSKCCGVKPTTVIRKAVSADCSCYHEAKEQEETPMVCFHCGVDFVIEVNWPGFNPEKICFCSLLCAAKGAKHFTPIVVSDQKKTPLTQEKKKKQEESDKDEEEYPDEWLFM